MPAPFLKDRAAFMGRDFPGREIVPFLKGNLHSQLKLASELVGDKTWILGTETLSAVDLHMAMDTFFAINVLTPTFVIENFPVLMDHFQRVSDAVNTDRTEEMPSLSEEEALQIAKAASGSGPSQRQPFLPELKLGQHVSVTPLDTGRVPATGVLVSLTTEEVIIQKTTDVAGSVYIHFPIAGFIVTPAQASL